MFCGVALSLSFELLRCTSGRCQLFQRLVALVSWDQFSLEMFLEKLESCLIFVVLFSALLHHKNSKSDHTIVGANWRFYDRTVEKINKTITVISCTNVGKPDVLQSNDSLKLSQCPNKFCLHTFALFGVKDIDM